jgi:hypothetical protein
MNQVLLKTNKLDKNFCAELRENLRAFNWLPFYMIYRPPHFNDALFASEN